MQYLAYYILSPYLFIRKQNKKHLTNKNRNHESKCKNAKEHRKD